MTPAVEQAEERAGECSLADGGDQKTGEGAVSAQGEEDNRCRYQDDCGFDERAVAHAFMRGGSAGRAAGGLDP